ncbi:MAG: hypothetical protein ACO263_02370 [Cyclobacteriaceae bacterium]
MHRFVLLFGLLFSSATAWTQTFTVSQVLRSALNSFEVNGFENQIVWLNQGRYGLPWINTLEFRTRNNELLYNRQQYALRLDIENPLKVIHNKRYFETQQQLSTLRRQRALKESLTNRYLLLVRLMEAEHVLSIRQKEDSLMRKLLEAHRSKVGLTEFKASDLVEAQLDVVSRQANLREAEFDFSVLESRIARLSGVVGSAIQGLNTQILPEQIVMVYDSVRQGVNLTVVMEKIKEVELANRKLAIDHVSYTMGWVQGMYVPYRREDGERPTGLALGITIPLFNKNKDDVARDRLDLIEEEAELQQLKSETADQWAERKESLRLLLKHYKNVIDQLNDLQVESFQTLDTIHNYDPVPRIKLEMELLKFKLLLSKIRYSILTEWILLLDDSDVIGQIPLRNYLSGNLERLD